jgi:hypothetical protein
MEDDEKSLNIPGLIERQAKNVFTQASLLAEREAMQCAN